MNHWTNAVQRSQSVYAALTVDRSSHQECILQPRGSAPIITAAGYGPVAQAKSGMPSSLASFSSDISPMMVSTELTSPPNPDLLTAAGVLACAAPKSSMGFVSGVPFASTVGECSEFASRDFAPSPSAPPLPQAINVAAARQANIVRTRSLAREA